MQQTLTEAKKQIVRSGGYAHVSAMPLEQRNAYAAEQLAYSLGLNGNFLYTNATERGIDLYTELRRFDNLTKGNATKTIKFASSLLDKVTV